MKIIVKDPETCNIRITIPNWLILNRLGVSVACNVIKKKSEKHGKDINLNKKETMAFVRQIRRAKKIFHNWDLVDVSASDGTTVKIKI